MRSMRAKCERDLAPELKARWGEASSEGSLLGWFLPEQGVQVLWESREWALMIMPLMPLVKLIGPNEGKLGGIVSEVLTMDRAAFLQRFPGAKEYKLAKDTTLEVHFAPVEMAMDESEIEARFRPSGELVAVELSLKLGAQKRVEAILQSLYGEPKDLGLCPASKKTCEIAEGVFQADPVMRYGNFAKLEVSTWAHDWAVFSIRWSRSKSAADSFSSLSPPHQVRPAEQGGP